MSRRLDELYELGTVVQEKCAEWPWAKCHGYGIVRKGNKTVRAHREVFLHVHGYTPKLIRHKCDNPACVNIGHLEEGTQKENMQDAVKRGRMSNGSQHGNPAISYQIVQEIRDNVELNQTQLAVMYSIHPSTVSRILAGKARSGD